ncbi:TVP38/TMEM64 family protein [Williamsia sterculiae]|uniref:TVP38/TMEM64 family protein n=1 Tax=Williamsia sterculiae TaxID=1344003 RepID=UPI0009711BE6|nr:TVP38/TMEM64 family protein [Williamsia sterculiae]
MTTPPDRTLLRAAIGGLVVLVVIGATYFLPIPSVGALRTWADSVGPGFVILFFVAYTLVTVAPVPRTAFTVSSGVLFGPMVGFTGAMIASTVAALLAFAISRRLGRRRVQGFLQRPIIATIEDRLRRRGWLAVGSLRLIAACPFSVVNYCAGLSAVRWRPYLLGTVVGMAPGTASVVFLGDALTGRPEPIMMVFTVVFFVLGLTGLAVDLHLDRHRGASGDPNRVAAVTGSHQPLELDSAE